MRAFSEREALDRGNEILEKLKYAKPDEKIRLRPKAAKPARELITCKNALKANEKILKKTTKKLKAAKTKIATMVVDHTLTFGRLCRAGGDPAKSHS
ncbi:MAG: hypothetical protein LBI29_00265 [Rickettsiales bacterium]|nr:hypothetical protein [Rickettsiales bacterium]